MVLAMRPVNGHDESGAVLILTALLVPALIAVGALALGVTTLWTGHHDVQRAADLGALAAAANTPTASNDLPLEGMARFHRLDELLDPTDWQQRPCAVVGQQLTGGRSVVANAFSDDEAAACDAVWTPESQLLAALGACAADIAELAGCRARLEAELRASLPVLTDAEASASDVAAQLHALLLDPADKLVDDALASDLGDACANEVSVLVIGLTCTHRVEQLLNAVDHRSGALVGTVDAVLQSLVTRLRAAATEGLLDPLTNGTGFDALGVPRVGLDLAGFVPAVVTPRVQVDVSGQDIEPPLSPFTFEAGATAMARRVIKSAVVVPTGIPGHDAVGTLPARTMARLEHVLGPDSAELLTAAGPDGWVIPPNVLDLTAHDVADLVIAMADELETDVSTSVNDSLCASLPIDVACPVGDDLVNRERLLGPFMEDLYDATQPPPSGTAPTIRELLADYADRGELVWMVRGLRPWLVEATFGEGVFTTLTQPVLPSAVDELLSPLMFVPALDVVPAAVIRDGDTFRIERVAATTGLYKARLVR